MRCALFTLAMGLGAVSSAAPLTVASYDMLNGNTGSYNYWDETYSGVGNTTTDGAPLSGGTGDLTDGVVATDNWYVVEAPAGNGPYVGWTIDPVITFNFSSLVSIDSVTIYADDSDGAGGVSLPTGVTIDGTLYDVDETMAGANPKALTFSGLDLDVTSLDIQLHRSNQWVFVSEVQFDGEPVPEPATLAVLGLGALAMRKRRRA